MKSFNCFSRLRKKAKGDRLKSGNDCPCLLQPRQISACCPQRLLPSGPSPSNNDFKQQGKEKEADAMHQLKSMGKRRGKFLEFLLVNHFLSVIAHAETLFRNLLHWTSIQKNQTMPKYVQADIFAYYKLYVKDHARATEISPASLWNEETDGAFELNEKCIQRIIERGIKKKIPFRKFKEGSHHGKSIAHQLKDVSKGTSDVLLADFVKLFNIKDITEFSNDKELTNFYKKKYAEERYVDPDFNACYIYYLWNGEDVQKAKMLCRWRDDKTVDKGKFVMCDYNPAGDKWEVPANDQSKQSVKAITQGTNLYLTFESKPPVALILHATDTLFSDKRFLLSTYTTTFNEKPVSGVGLLQKVELSEVKLRFDEPVAPEIYNFLFQRRSFLRDSEQTYVSKRSDARFVRQTDFVKGSHGDHLPGVYEGYFLDRHFEDTQALRRMLMEINPSGLIRFLNEGNITRGFGSLAAGGELLYITADYQIEIGGTPRVHIIVEVPNKNFALMEGCCSGYTVTNRPYIGQILFRKIKHVDTIERAQKNDFHPTEIIFEDQNKPEFENVFTADLLNFFYDQRFYSIPHACFQPHFFDKYTKSNKDYNGPKGFFHMYSTSTFQWNIICYPVLIDDSGEVKLKDRKQTVHTGTALIFMQDYLILTFNDFTNDVAPYVGNFIFYIHGNQIKRFASGISTRINSKKNPQAKREFLIRYPFNDYLATSKHRNDFSNFKKSKNAVFEKNSPEYEEVRKHYRRFDTLLGREYNLMVISKSATKEEKVFAREAFEEIYLHEAMFCFFQGIKTYKICKHFSGDVKEAIEHYLRLAMQHGFFEKDSILKGIDDYCNIVNRNSAQLIKYFGDLYDAILEKMKLQATK